MTTKKTTTTRKAASAKKATPKKTPATKAASKPRTTKSAKAATPAAKPKADAKPKAKAVKTNTPERISALDAAAKVLAEAGEPLNAKQMIEAMAEKGYWTSPGGKTPHATLYSAILREINAKGSESRFVKSDRGKFTRAS